MEPGGGGLGLCRGDAEPGRGGEVGVGAAVGVVGVSPLADEFVFLALGAGLVVFFMSYLIAAAEAYGETITEAVLTLIGVFLDDGPFQSRLDLAMRGWAHQDDTVASEVNDADAALWQRGGHGAGGARRLARPRARERRGDDGRQSCGGFRRPAGLSVFPGRGGRSK
mgnify:CR=1 FL=1